MYVMCIILLVIEFIIKWD